MKAQCRCALAPLPQRPPRRQLQRFVIFPLFETIGRIRTVSVVPTRYADLAGTILPTNTPTFDPMLTAIYNVYTFVAVGHLLFVWDEGKNRLNMRKHGISFEEARTAFFDEGARVVHDPDHSATEDRFVLLGMSLKPRLLLECHCYRESEEEIRIISARKATRTEHEQYGRSQNA
jgi:uncharacterized protein